MWPELDTGSFSSSAPVLNSELTEVQLLSWGIASDTHGDQTSTSPGSQTAHVTPPTPALSSVYPTPSRAQLCPLEPWSLATSLPKVGCPHSEEQMCRHIHVQSWTHKGGSVAQRPSVPTRRARRCRHEYSLVSLGSFSTVVSAHACTHTHTHAHAHAHTHTQPNLNLTKKWPKESNLILSGRKSCSDPHLESRAG